MNAKQWLNTLTMSAALAVTPAVALAQGGSLGNNSDTYTVPKSRPAADHGYGTGTVSGNVAGDPAAGLPLTQSDVDEWMRNESVRNNGRISRRAYLDYMGRRWDAADTTHQGLTPAEVSRLTGRVDSNAPAPLNGSGQQGANMGPGNSRGQ